MADLQIDALAAELGATGMIAAARAAVAEREARIAAGASYAHEQHRGERPTYVRVLLGDDEHALAHCTCTNARIDTYAHYRGRFVPIGQLNAAQRDALRRVLVARAAAEQAENFARIETRMAAEDLAKSRLGVRAIGAALNYTGGRISQILNADADG